MTTTATTTEAPLADDTQPLPITPRQARRPEGGRPGLSVRVRITATVAVLVLLALATAGLVVYLVEQERLQQQTVGDVDRVLDEFAQESAESSETRLDAVLRDFLRAEVASGTQVFAAVNVTSGRLFSAEQDPLLTDPEIRSAIDRVAEDGGSIRVQAGGRPLMVSSQRVELDDERGAFIVLSDLSEDGAYLSDTVRTYIVVSLLAFLVVTGVAFWQSGRLLRPLRAVRETAEEISGTDLSRRLPVRGNDDITALTRTVNGMLDRLEVAFVGQREFLDDAGHELKTPLTVLRGHLELLDVDDPAEVAETQSLLLDEIDRMARLVGDLILLAKTDRPGFLVRNRVDLRSLTETVLAKARGLGERDWHLDATADCTLELDEQRITQALLQLADNAVKHTTEGDVVAVGSEADAQEVRLWVRDTGPGVPEADRERIFERFGRSVVLPGDEGFGLGLSIVQAIAAAHQGRSWLDTSPPGGARFVISLPRTVPHPTEVQRMKGETWPAS